MRVKTTALILLMFFVLLGVCQAFACDSNADCSVTAQCVEVEGHGICEANVDDLPTPPHAYTACHEPSDCAAFQWCTPFNATATLGICLN